MSKVVNVHEAKTQLSALIKLVLTGKSVIICNNGRPVVDMVPHVSPLRTMVHPVMSKVDIKYDPTESMSDDEWGDIE